MAEKTIEDIYQADIAVLLRALDLSDHARPISCHQVLVEEIIPAIHLRMEEAKLYGWNAALGEIQAKVDELKNSGVLPVCGVKP